MSSTVPATDRTPTCDFSIYGMRVRSPLRLSGWPTLPEGPAPDITIVREAIPTPVVEGAPHSARSLVEDGEVRVGVRGVARYRATGGTVIQVDPEPSARPEDVQLYLTGAMMGAIFHQRGVFPLHASCVVMEGQAVALAGPSGAGKSTLMVALVRHGAGFVSDDICVLSPLAGARFGVLPSLARAKLDLASLASLNHGGQDLESAGGDRGKFHVPVRTLDVPGEPPPLTSIFLLRDGEGDPRIERLQGLEAVAALVEETYFLRYVVALGLAAPCFRHAGAVARKVRVARLVRPRGFDHLPLLVDLIGTGARQV